MRLLLFLPKNRITRLNRRKFIGKFGILIFLFMIHLLWSTPLQAFEFLTVGVAANFILPFKSIVQRFENKTSTRIEAIYTSTGRLYGQIKNGAPYDLFLAADELRPNQLLEEGLVEETFLYARGKVVLWTVKKELCQTGDWPKIVSMPEVKRIAIANPETAPYGSASVAALKAVGVWEGAQPKLVFAQTVAQAFQYAYTQSTDIGFCALSSAYSDQGKKGCLFFMKEAPEIIQAGCVLKRTSKRGLAKKFAAFLLSPEADGIKKKFGYD